MSEPFYNPNFKNEGQRQKFIGKMLKKGHLERGIINERANRKERQLSDNFYKGHRSKLNQATFDEGEFGDKDDEEQVLHGYHWRTLEEKFFEPRATGVPAVPGDTWPYNRRLYTEPPHPPRPPSP